MTKEQETAQLREEVRQAHADYLAERGLDWDDYDEYWEQYECAFWDAQADDEELDLENYEDYLWAWIEGVDD